MKTKVVRVLNIPEQLHREFKMLCVRRSVTMNDQLISLMKIEVEMDKERRLK